MDIRHNRRSRVVIVIVTGVVAVALVLGLGAALLASAPGPAATDSGRGAGSVALRDFEESWNADPETTRSVVPASAVGVIDGDSVVFRYSDGKVEEIRLIGLDAPELRYQRDLFGMKSAERAADLLREQPRVFLETGPDRRDRYGRRLAYVWFAEPDDDPSAADVREHMLNAELLLAGYAKLYSRAPNDRYAALFELYAKQAKATKSGLWDPEIAADAGPTTAWDSSITSDPNAQSAPYVGNATTKFFHRVACENALKMKVRNRIPLESAKQALKLGYKPCGLCDP